MNTYKFVFASVPLLLTLGCSAKEPPACFVDISVHDATGNKLRFTITAVRAQENSILKDRNLLKEETGHGFMAQGDRLYFERPSVGDLGTLEVTLEGGRRGRVTTSVVLVDCRQRSSAVVGESVANVDSTVSLVDGRLVGCPLDGDWWIRAMPMFGSQTARGSFEGYIDHTTGEFRLNEPMNGIRHILIVGKGKFPVKAFPVDVVLWGHTEVGNLDLSGACPK